MHLADEVLDHFLGDFEVRDHAIAQRPDRLNIAGRSAQHLFRFITNGENLFLAAHSGDSDNRRFIEDDAATFHVDQRVRCPKVNRHVGGEHAK